MSDKWIEEKERSNPFTLKLICWIALNTSRTFARLFLYPITLYFLLTSPRVRKASRNYLARVPGSKNDIWQVAKHIYCFSATILDRVYFLTDQTEKFEIKISKKNLLDELVKKNSGCILLGSHIGSFEVLRSLAISQMDLPVKILMHQEHNQMITQVLEALNPKVAESVINLADPNALLKLKECVDQGDLVGVLADRVSEGDKTVSCNFLGDAAEFPQGPAKLAAVLNVPVIMFAGLYRGGNKYEIYFEKLTDGLNVSRNNMESEIENLIYQYVERIEHYLKLAPLNWFNFYDFWHDEKTQ